ncbi:TetR/AcrR family transcriptional regulator [Rhodococcus sp. H29-C3]|uniref:TetR/AcrR family transcriptional regulator n=1 Tax=Rhodococcus sp. H29-C3 TaxID=3046307 RepID=UPI0024BA62C7|nr:TetR/AcrR family transcriptional regulator [Rhodococcus sp. H29-C3]MDJ0362683.1 helix-turn-helix domain-containing protein [Rhodococcus sp. H29-C3]
MAGPGAPISPWLRDERTEIAAERILDAAAELFVVRGVANTGMAEIAKAAGCSRATLYRYFENRRALHLAFVHREARRLGERLGKQVAVLEDPRRRVVEGILGALREVRATPILAAWFELSDAAIASEIANTSKVIEVLGAELLANAGTLDQQELFRRSRWLVRVIVSLLTVPGADEAEERAMIEQFVVPALLAPF